MSDDKMTAYLKQAAPFRFGGLCSGLLQTCVRVYQRYLHYFYAFYGLYDMCVRVWGCQVLFVCELMCNDTDTEFSWMIDRSVKKQAACLTGIEYTDAHTET